MRKRVSRGIVMPLAMALSLGAAWPAGAQENSVLRVVPSADLTILDPMFSPIIITRLYSLMVYETLFSWDSNLQPQPQMVGDFSISDDQLTWNFTLRHGLEFHDGSAVTTNDVIASLTRWMKVDGSFGQATARVVDYMEAVDEDTFKIVLKEPAPYLTFALGSATGQIPAIMRAVDLEGDLSDPVTTAIGSGPFKFNKDRWVSGSVVVFDKFDDYVPREEPADGLAGGREVKVDTVEWRILPDAATAAAAIQTGEVDLLEQPPLELLPVMRSNPDVEITTINGLNYQGALRGNALYPPFDNPKARQALAYLAPQSDYMIATVGTEGGWQECASYFICGGPFGEATNTSPVPEADLEKAASLMREAGYDGETLIFVASKDLAPIGQMTEVAADAMRRAGINVDVQWADWGTTARRQTMKDAPGNGGYHLFVTYSTGIVAHSPMTNVGTNMACDQSNFNGWPCDEEAERLRQAFIESYDLESRQEAASTLQARLEEVRPYIPLGEFEAPVAVRREVKGLLQSPVIAYWNISKD